MSHPSIQQLLQSQRDFYRTGKTLSVTFRKEQLKKLYSAVRKYEVEINEALQSDLGKSYSLPNFWENASHRNM